MLGSRDPTGVKTDGALLPGGYIYPNNGDNGMIRVAQKG